MRPYACLVCVLIGTSGCISIEPGPEPGYAPGSFNGGVRRPMIPGVMGPHGEAVPMAAPYAHRPPANAAQAHYMMSQHQALTDVQINTPNMAMPSGPMPGAAPPQVPMPGGMLLSPPGVPGMPGAPGNSMAPFAQPGGPGNAMPPFPPGGGVMQAKGFGMDSGLMQAKFSPETPSDGVTQAAYPPGVVAAMGAIPPSDGVRFSVQRTQVRFMRPSGMKIAWFTRGANGQAMYSSNPIEAPGRYNFQQGAVYRLKLSNIEGRPGLEVYPTLEVVPVNVKTEAFLAHSAVPIDFTDEDFNQVAQGNFVVKVIYLPDSEFQEFAGAGVDQILSTQLEPGADPIKEALRRGSILLVVRMGNVDQEAPNTPGLGSGGNQGGMSAFNQGAYGPCPPPMVPYILPPGMMPPGGGMPPPGMFMPPAQNGGVGGQQDKNAGGPMTSLPGSNVPALVPPPSNAMVRPLDQMPSGPTLPPFGDVPPVLKETPGTLTGRGGMATPEMAPAPTETPETALPPKTPLGNARPEPMVPDELLHSMPPTLDPGTAAPPNGVQNPTKFTPAPDEGLPPEGVTAPTPPRSALEQGGPPAMLPPTDPGQGEDLQRIGGATRPTNLNVSSPRTFP